MGKVLSFDTGLVEYDINGAVTVRFNPTRKVDEIGEDGAAMFAYAKERDREMRGIIDGLLGEGVADALFANMNCYALADGLPVWINLMFAVADEIQSAYTAEQKKTDPRIAGYNKKYQGMMQKYKRGK